ncbi:MAG TPA: hypothetical protein V6D17_14925 [Candidatus Obscuribacterales bacterium]
MSNLDGNIKQLFEEAKKDGIITTNERAGLLKDLTVADWQAITKEYTDENRLYGVKGGLYVSESEDAFVIHNNPGDVRYNDFANLGRSSMFGLGTGLGSLVGYKAFCKFVMKAPGPLGKLTGLGALALTTFGPGIWKYKSNQKEYKDLMENPDIVVPKSSLAEAKEARLNSDNGSVRLASANSQFDLSRVLKRAHA